MGFEIRSLNNVFFEKCYNVLNVVCQIWGNKGLSEEEKRVWMADSLQAMWILMQIKPN